MNRQEKDILLALNSKNYQNQRGLSEETGHSLGIVNRSLKNLRTEEYLENNLEFTIKAKELMESSQPKNAIILAAGRGVRMIPINQEVSKGLLEIKKEPLIERIIKQLKEVGVEKIYIVVGFMKETYEYLIDEYGVELILNMEYENKNNLHSLKLASNYLSNSYIVPCDIWCKENIFRKNELYSWYMVTKEKEANSMVKINKKSELIRCKENEYGNRMLGICYLREEDSKEIIKKLEAYDCQPKYFQSFWEETLFIKEKMIVDAKIYEQSEVYEINTYEQLRELDEDSEHLESEVLNLICGVLKVRLKDIQNIKVLKKGMTNRSFVFECRGRKYIMRIPGEGTEKLINRKREGKTYESISGKNICDNVLYFDVDKGYKLSEFFVGARVCNPRNQDDLKRCMKKLRDLHERNLRTDYSFDLFQEIEFYESLWKDKQSIYRDYEKTKNNILSLKKYIEDNIEAMCLAHIDAIPDNFLFIESDGKKEVRLIDWEYAGMQDPHVDLAMFSIYSFYNKEEIDNLIRIYFEGECRKTIRLKIYAYIAVCGLLWSNWCEYKRNFGVEFGEYSLKQYRYAKEYYKIFMEELQEEVKDA